MNKQEFERRIEAARIFQTAELEGDEDRFPDEVWDEMADLLLQEPEVYAFATHLFLTTDRKELKKRIVDKLVG